MAVINTLVAKSTDVKAAALNLNAKAFEIRQTIAGVWDLKPSAVEAPESAFSLDMKNATDESVVGEGDDRVKVDERHFQPGGKYRSTFLSFRTGRVPANHLRYCEVIHTLRVSGARKMGDGYWLACST